jgi:molecular chaperone Hsp33
MTARLESLPPFEQVLAEIDGSPARLLDELLYQMPYAQLDTRAVAFGCQCSHQAVVASLASLDRQSLAEIVTEQSVVELSCDYCNTDYVIQSSQLLGLLETS